MYYARIYADSKGVLRASEYKDTPVPQVLLNFSWCAWEGFQVNRYLQKNKCLPFSVLDLYRTRKTN